MPDGQDERRMDAPDPPAFTSPLKHSRNSDAGHTASDAEGTVNGSQLDAEMQRVKEPGKKHKYQGYLDYRVIGTWVKGDQGQLDDTDIDHGIRKRMERFKTDSRLFKPPGHHGKPTNIHLWKQLREPYFNSRSDEWIRPFRCSKAKRCDCKTQVRIRTGDNYQRLEFTGDHNEHSHANDKSKKLKHKEIIAIHDEVLVRAYCSVLFWNCFRNYFALMQLFGTELRRNLNCEFMSNLPTDPCSYVCALRMNI
jgi:hypothetical protein